MNPVAAEAPTGYHQVLATKKYVLTSVITQINSSNARPIPQSSPRRKTIRKDFPTAVAPSHNAGNSRRRVYHSRAAKKQGSSRGKLAKTNQPRICTDCYGS